MLAFPAANLEAIAWIGLVPGLALMSCSPGRREAVVRGWWYGAGYLLTAMYWLTPNLGPALLLVAAGMGALWAIVGLAAWSLLRPPVTIGRAAAALAVLPSCWLVTEWLRSWQALGGPWAVFGASQWQHPEVLALAAAGGVWLITFALVVANTGVLIALTGSGIAARLTGLGALLAAVGAGPLAFALIPPPPAGLPVTIALVQPNLTPNATVRLTRNEQLTAAAAGRAQLFVWGESSVGFDLVTHPAIMTAIERISGRAGAQILVNQDTVTAHGPQKQSTLIGPGGVAGSYAKTRLVPFGEYIPFRPVLGWLTAISRAAPVNFTPGTGAHILHATLPGGRRVDIGVLICFESAFPDMSRVDVSQGARVIIYQTADTTFQDSWEPAQHASLSALRAAETGRPVVQAALTGDSVAFDSRGRQLARSGTSVAGTLLVRLSLPPASYRTPFDRVGDVVPWTAVAVAALAALIGLARAWLRRRDRGRPALLEHARILTDNRL